MRNYELMVILDPSIDERTVAPVMEKYLAPVAANGGSVENLDIWGKRRLAYDILKRSEGIYVVIDMTTTPESLSRSTAAWASTRPFSVRSSCAPTLTEPTPPLSPRSRHGRRYRHYRHR